MHALSRVYSNFISLYLCICKDDNVKWWGDNTGINWDNSFEREIVLNIYPSPFIFTNNNSMESYIYSYRTKK